MPLHRDAESHRVDVDGLHDAVVALNGVEEVEVKLVFDPPWDASRLSDVARLELGMM